MADQQKDNGPYNVYGRRTEHEGEVRSITVIDLDTAKAEADEMVDSGVWHQVDVRDRENRTVYTSRKEDAQKHHGGQDDIPPAA